MERFSTVILALCLLAKAQQTNVAPGVSSYTAPTKFPTTISAFSRFYVPPAPTQEPQPALHDPVLNITFPLNLTDPNNIPDYDDDPVVYPPAPDSGNIRNHTLFVDTTVGAIRNIINGNAEISGGNCSRCLAALELGQKAARVAPDLVPGAMVALCQSTKFASNSTCEENYSAHTFGAIWTQVLSLADVGNLDGHYVCNALSTTFCSLPYVTPLDTKNLFPKPKPEAAQAPKASGKRTKVLHMSDWHLDPRYSVGAEANCSSGLCCRSNNHNSVLGSGQVSLQASLYGWFSCDSPYYLITAALQSIGPLSGTSDNSPFGFTIYTGDLVSHDPQTQLSRAYTEYAEFSLYSLFHQYVKGPIFAVLGNHDSNPEAIDAPHSLPGPLGQQLSWNYDHVAGLWQKDGWISPAAAQEARLHYGAYSMKSNLGLRIITLNTDFWYKSNFLNYINMVNPDVSGQQKFLIDELQAAEDAGERVWILGHVLPGWDGTNPLPNPTDLFYQIVDRYSPHVIANVFFGHTHEDELMIYYANNGTERSRKTAQTPGWIGPSLTPLTNLNSGFRMYEVDTHSFDIYEAYTFNADVNSFPRLDKTGPIFRFEYSTRQTYDTPEKWPAHAPLNATYWHGVTEAMENNLTMVEVFNTFQGKESVKTPACNTTACQTAKICYMRSGSEPLGRQCPQGYGSVQSAFKPPK